MTQARQTLGALGEQLASDALVARGYAILARRYRSRCGEIDIVARDGATLVFVEVKTRDGRCFGDGAEAVDWRKQRHLVQTAIEFLARHRLTHLPCRFDVVAITLTAATPEVEIYQHAFSVESVGRWGSG